MKKEKGFTLIEVMITVAIVSIIAVAVYNAYFGSLKAWNYNKNRLEVQRVQDLTHRWISQYARKAKYINPNYTTTSFTAADNLLYLEYEEDGNTKEVAFGLGSNNEDYLYFYDITGDSKRKISNLKFDFMNFDYYKKSEAAAGENFYDLIKMDAGIMYADNELYQYSSYFNPRFVEITTP